MKKIIYFILRARMEVFRVYGYITLMFCCVLMNTVGFLRAPLGVRLWVCWLWSFLYRLGVLFILQIYVKVEGKEHIQNGPAIYVSKHQSMLETFMFYGFIGRCCFAMKQELMEKPIFGQAQVYAEAIPVNREAGVSALKKVLSEGKDRVQNKKMSIIVFPEGTRVAVGDYPKFHRSAMKLATVANVPIVPVAHNFGAYFGRKKGDFIKPGIARMSFEPSISPEDYNINELTEKCYDIVTAKTKEFGG